LAHLFERLKQAGTPFWGKKASRRTFLPKKKSLYTILKKTKQVGIPFLEK